MNTNAAEPNVSFTRVQLRFAGTRHKEWAPAGRRAVAFAPYEHLEGEEAFHAITMTDVDRSQGLEGAEMRSLANFKIGDEVYVHDGEPTPLKVLNLLWRATIVATE